MHNHASWICEEGESVICAGNPSSGWGGFDHGVVHHSADEWERGLIHTNTIEGFFGISKRGMKGVYQHCAERHLHRYMADFDFRYSNRQANGFDDSARSIEAMRGIVGKRLMFGDSSAWLMSQ